MVERRTRALMREIKFLEVEQAQRQQQALAAAASVALRPEEQRRAEANAARDAESATLRQLRQQAVQAPCLTLLATIHSERSPAISQTDVWWPGAAGATAAEATV